MEDLFRQYRYVLPVYNVKNENSRANITGVFPKPMTSLFQKYTFSRRKSVSFTVGKANLLGWTTSLTCFQFDVVQHNLVILPSSRTSSNSKYQTSIKCPSQQVTHLYSSGVIWKVGRAEKFTETLPWISVVWTYNKRM